MANCGCNSSNHEPGCYGRNNAKEQVLYPVLRNDCSGNSGTPSNCPEGFQPFSRTGSECVTVPAIGGTFNISVCDASNFIIGMWVQMPGLGTYPIVGVNAATNLITLRNSCANGTTAITGNPEPGSQFCGSLPIWLGRQDPCMDAQAFCAQVVACLESVSEDNPICLPDVPVATEGQCVRILGLSAACDAGDCPQPDDPNCLTKVDSIRVCKDTIIFDDGLKEVDEDSDECYSPVVVGENGDLAKSSTGNLMYFLRARTTDITVTDQNSAGLVAAMNFSVDTASFGVPDCAKGVALRVFYTWDHGDDDNLKYNTYIRADGDSVNNQNNLIMSVDNGGSIADQPATNSAFTIIKFGNGNRIIHHEFQALAIDGNDNDMRVYIAIDAYLQ